jgi:hypothetical protein
MPRLTRLSVPFNGTFADPSYVDSDEPVSLRLAGEADATALESLRQLDSCRWLPPPPHLVAEVDGSIRAARSLRTGETFADPFTHTAHLRHMLAVRATQLVDPPPRRRLAVPWTRALRWARGHARGEAW